MTDAAAALVVFDLDGTLLRGDTVCEGVARHIGRLRRMREMECAFWSSVAADREEMASWYQPYAREHLAQGLRYARLAPGAQEGVRLLDQCGITVAICSATWAFGVEWVADRLGVRHFVGTGLDPAGRITHFGPDDKPLWTDRLRAQLGIPAERVAAVGDSGGDIPLLRAVPHAYFVGKDLPATLGDHATHLPDGDIREVALHILGRLG